MRDLGILDGLKEFLESKVYRIHTNPVLFRLKLRSLVGGYQGGCYGTIHAGGSTKCDNPAAKAHP
jgi:hypothetical protein